VRKRRQMLLQFVGWPARRNEVNLVEVKSPVCGSRHGQVPCMNGIKRAAKQCDSSWLVFGRRAVRLRCRQSPSRSIPNPILSRILRNRWPGVVSQALLHVPFVCRVLRCSLATKAVLRLPCRSHAVSEPFVSSTSFAFFPSCTSSASVSSSSPSFGILSSASAIPRTNSFTPSPVAAEIA
jgi:hypothetical protein